MKRMLSGACLLALSLAAACGDGEPAERAAEAVVSDAASGASAASLPLSPTCRNLERIVAARTDVPAFSSLPEGFALTDEVACSAREGIVKAGPDKTPSTLPGYACVFMDAPGAEEAPAWPIWQGVQAIATECAVNGWTMLAETDGTERPAAVRLLYRRDPDALRLVLPQGETEAVRFQWSQQGGQTITLFVAAP